MNTDELDQKTDAELNEIFTVEVAEYVLHDKPFQPPMSKLEVAERWCYRDRDGNFYLGEPYALHKAAFEEIGLRWGYMWTRPKFCTDANSVLPWLEKHRPWGCDSEDPKMTNTWRIQVGCSVIGGDMEFARSQTFARSAVIALIRAKRASK